VGGDMYFKKPPLIRIRIKVIVMSCNDSSLSEKLVLYAEGALSGEEQEEIDKHISVCSSCKKEMEELTGIMSIINKTSNNIRKKIVYPSEEEMVDIALSPRNLEEKRMKEITEQIFLHQNLKAEYDLLKESPHIEGKSPDSERISTMPEKLIAAHKTLYKNQNSECPINRIENFFGTIFDRLLKNFSPSIKFAYNFLVILAILGITVILVYTTNEFSNYSCNVENCTPSFVTYQPFALDDKNIDMQKLATKMRSMGIPAKIENGNFQVPQNLLKKAKKVLADYNREQQNIRKGKTLWIYSLPEAAPDK
jgi:hypothetical protein